MSALSGLRKAGVADALTVGNGVCGAAAIALLLTQGRDITLGTALILLGFVLDGADGWAARRWGTKHDLGRHLDSASDAVTFCAAPAVMAWVAFHGAVPAAEGSTEDFFTGLLFLTCVCILVLGLVRLYNYTTHGFKQPHFRGLATPAMAFLTIMVSHVLNPLRWQGVGAGPGVPLVAVLVLLVASLLMVSRVEYPRPRARTGAVLAVAVLGCMGAIGAMRALDVAGTDAAFRAVAVGALGLVAGYVLLGPVWMALRGRGRAPPDDL